MLIRIAVALIAFLLAMYILAKMGYNKEQNNKSHKKPDVPQKIITFEEEKE
jgi:hypothetical protein